MKLPLLITILALTLSACTTVQQTAYLTTQAYQRQECQKMNNDGDRQQCLKKADMSYEEYLRQTQNVK